MTDLNLVTNDDESELQSQLKKLLRNFFDGQMKLMDNEDFMDAFTNGDFEKLIGLAGDETTTKYAERFIPIFTADKEKAVKQAEEITADIEFKAGVDHATMSGEYVTKSDLEKAVLDGRIEEVHKICGNPKKGEVGYTLKMSRLAELQNQRKAMDNE
jgi:hypothetical protein